MVIAISKGMTSKEEIAGILGLKINSIGALLSGIFSKLKISEVEGLLKKCFPDIGKDEFQKAVDEWKKKLELTPKQGECLSAIFNHHSVKAIARELGAKVGTVKDHLKDISIKYKKSFNVTADEKVRRVLWLYELLDLAREIRNEELATAKMSEHSATAPR